MEQKPSVLCPILSDKIRNKASVPGTKFNIIYHKLFENCGKVFLYIFCCLIFYVKKTTNKWNIFFFTKLRKPFFPPKIESAQTDTQSDHSSCCFLKKKPTDLNIFFSVVFLSSGELSKNCCTKKFVLKYRTNAMSYTSFSISVVSSNSELNFSLRFTAAIVCCRTFSQSY